MRILIIGSGGMLGYVTFRFLQEQGHQVTGITRTKSFPGMFQIDAADKLSLMGILSQTPFDAVINFAALLGKASEEHPSDAVRTNAWLPHFLAEYCACQNTYLLHVSTDGIFSGKRGGYREDDCSDVEGFYGRSKFLGEVSGREQLTVRSGFWGADVNPAGTGLFQWFMHQQGAVSGYSKAVFNGVSNLEFAIFANNAVQNRWRGVYHLCASESISKYDFLCMQKQIFDVRAEIREDSTVQVDRSLLCTRTDIPYRPKSFRQMMYELRDWKSGKFSK